MEEEVRIILRGAVQNGEEPCGIGTRIHRRFIEAGAVDLPEPERLQEPRKPESFG
jgi:hypothetical protein